MTSLPPSPDPNRPPLPPPPTAAPAPPAPGWWLASDGQWYPPQVQAPAGYMAYATAPRAPSTNGMAIASMVLGILWLYWIGSILALVFGYVAKGQIKASGGAQSGEGMATAGIVLGWIGVGILSLIVVIAILGAVAGAG